jgi:hypothetical protein
MKHFFLILFICASGTAISQILTDEQKNIISKTVANQFGDFIDNINYNIGYKNIAIVSKDTLYNPEGYHYVFLLTKGTCKRLDHSKHHGGNFNRYLFSWNKKLVALGGYGFFTTNNNLIEFNRKSKGWIFIPTRGPKPKFIFGLTFKNNHLIYSFNNVKSGNSTTNNIFDKALYILNLRTKSWEKHNLLDTSLFFNGINFQLKDFVFYGSTEKCILIKPKTLEYQILKNQELGMPPGYSISYINNNTICLKDIASNMSGERTYDFEKIWNSYRFHKKIKYYTTSKNKIDKAWKNYFIVILIIAITILLFLFVHLYLKIKSLQKKNIRNYTETHLTLLKFSNSILSQEEFDEILGINKLEQDSKKLKRFRIIEELNLNHPLFIERIKDSSDKRRNVYKINK